MSLLLCLFNYNRGMSFGRSFRYSYKKSFAILFATLGLALYAANVIAMAISGFLTGAFDILSIALTIFAYMVILSGNIQSNDYAYQGVGLFILWTTIDYIFEFFYSLMDVFSTLATGNPELIVLSVIVFVFLAGAITCGIFSYMRIRQYLTSRYAYYNRVRNWTLAFVICLSISSAFYPALIILTYYLSGTAMTWVVFVLGIAPYLSNICIAIACYFTVLRLKSNF